MITFWNKLSGLYSQRGRSTRHRIYSRPNQSISAIVFHPPEIQSQANSNSNGKGKGNSSQTKKLPSASHAFILWSAIDLPWIKIQHLYDQPFEEILGNTRRYMGRFGTMGRSGMISLTYESFRDFVELTRTGISKKEEDAETIKWRDSGYVRDAKNYRDSGNEQDTKAVNYHDSKYEADSDLSSYYHNIDIRSASPSPIVPFPAYTEPIPTGFKLAKLLAVFREGKGVEEEVDISVYEDGVFEFILMKMMDRRWVDEFRAVWEPVYDYSQ